MKNTKTSKRRIEREIENDPTYIHTRRYIPRQGEVRQGEMVMDEPFEKKEYADDYDIIKSLQTVYDKRKFSLNENFTLMKGKEDKLKEFVARQHMTARKIYAQIPDKRYAQLAYDIIMLELNDRAIMNRNEKGNLIVEGIISRGQPEGMMDKITEEKKEGIVGGAKKRLKSLIAPNAKVKEEEQKIIGG